MAQNYLLRYDQPCSSTVRNAQGQTVIYTGYMGTDGKCHYFNRRVVDKSAFNGERAVWSDLAGYSNADGDSCAFKNPDGSITTGVMKSGLCTMPEKGKGWDFANNLLNLAQGLIGPRQDAGTTDASYMPPPPQKKGIGTLGVVGIVAGVGLVGFLIYKMAK